MATKPSDGHTPKQDLYEVLEVDSTATQEAIKSAYKKAALRHHPDKNTGAGAEKAAVRFQEISAAYAVLSDPIKRARYDSKGFAGLEPSELDAEVDVSSLGLFGTVAAAMFSKLGVPIRTSIAATVLEEAYEGRFKAEQLKFGEPAICKMEKGQAVFFEINVSQAQVDRGFLIGATSAIGSKFKLLLFELASETKRWELQSQDDSIKSKKGPSLAALLFLDKTTHRIGPKPVLEAAKNPEAHLFMRLESMVPREPLPVKPGKLLFAVYNDNWFKRAQVTVTAAVPSEEPRRSATLASLQHVEGQLLTKQEAIRKFETEYRKVQEKWRAASEEFAALSGQVEEALQQREEAYLGLLGGQETAPSELSHAHLFQGWGIARKP